MLPGPRPPGSQRVRDRHSPQARGSRTAVPTTHPWARSLSSWTDSADCRGGREGRRLHVGQGEVGHPDLCHGLLEAVPVEGRTGSVRVTMTICRRWPLSLVEVKIVSEVPDTSSKPSATTVRRDGWLATMAASALTESRPIATPGSGNHSGVERTSRASRGSRGVPARAPRHHLRMSPRPCVASLRWQLSSQRPRDVFPQPAGALTRMSGRSAARSRASTSEDDVRMSPKPPVSRTSRTPAVGHLEGPMRACRGPCRAFPARLPPPVALQTTKARGGLDRGYQ